MRRGLFGRLLGGRDERLQRGLVLTLAKLLLSLLDQFSGRVLDDGKGRYL